MSEKRVYSPDFFHSQGVFAVRLYQVLTESGISISFEEVLKQNTALYREVTHKGKNQVGLDVWHEVTDKSQNKPDAFTDYLITQLYRAYVENAGEADLTQGGDTCLQTEWVPEAQGIQMHYIPSILNGKSTLSAVNRPYRFSEYFERFQQLRQLYPEDTKMFGFSWLYNLQIYTWLFPSFNGYFRKDGSQLKNLETGDYSVGERMYPFYDPRHILGTTPMPLNSWAIWGQFLQKGYETNLEQIQSFEKAVEKADSIVAAIDSFPYPLRYYENTLGAWWQHLTQIQDS